jgi:hypothetical protein
MLAYCLSVFCVRVISPQYEPLGDAVKRAVAVYQICDKSLTNRDRSVLTC